MDINNSKKYEKLNHFFINFLSIYKFLSGKFKIDKKTSENPKRDFLKPETQKRR
jgi:hypothetical protein